MKKRLIELQKLRASAIGKMKETFTKADAENRVRTHQEVKEWESLYAQVKAYTGEIKKLEVELEQEGITDPSKIDLSGGNFNTKNNFSTMKNRKKYDLAKAIKEHLNGKLTGLEAEIQTEGEKELSQFGAVKGIAMPSMMFHKEMFEDVVSDLTAEDSAGQIATSVTALDLIMAKSKIRQLGVTEYSMTSKCSIPHSKGHIAAKLAEGAAASQGAPTQTSSLLAPYRFQAYDVFSQEFLAVNASSDYIAQSMIQSIDAAVCKDIFNKAVVAGILTGYAASDTAVIPGWPDILKLLASVENDEFLRPGYVLSKPLYHKLQAVEVVAGSGRFLIDNNKINSEAAIGSSLLPVHDTNKYDIIYGDWAKAFVAWFGGYQILVDPYSKADNGQVKITYLRMADAAASPYAFASIRNGKIA